MCIYSHEKKYHYQQNLNPDDDNNELDLYRTFSKRFTYNWLIIHITFTLVMETTCVATVALEQPDGGISANLQCAFSILPKDSTKRKHWKS